MAQEIYSEELSDLEFTRSKRKEIVGKLTSQGIPGDTDELRLLAGVLTDMDRASLGKMKIKSEDSNNSDNINAQAAIAAMLVKMDPAKIIQAGKSERQIPTLPASVPSPDIIPGETTVGTQSGSYEAFAAEHFKINN